MQPWISRRVWSWLRMNAGGMLNTCKLDGWVTRKKLPLRGEQQLEMAANTSQAEEQNEEFAWGGARVWLASWWGNTLPRRWSVVGSRGWSVILGLRHGPDSYGRQQWGIFRNGRKPDGAMLREGRRPMGRELLFPEKKQWQYLGNKHQLTLCQQPW